MKENLNIEIKARIADADKMHRMLLSAGAEYKGKDHQIDTYFNVESGRLKIREGTIENCIVHYARPDDDGPKRCEYSIIKYDSADRNLSVLKKILTDAVGIFIIVEKERHIYFIDTVKFHLDNVAGLGSFFEIEVINDGTLTEFEQRTICKSYLDRLGITINSYVNCSYSDMISANQTCSGNHPICE